MSDYDAERLNEAQMALEDAQERIRNLEMALADMTVLASDYRAWAKQAETAVLQHEQEWRQFIKGLLEAAGICDPTPLAAETVNHL